MDIYADLPKAASQAAAVQPSRQPAVAGPTHQRQQLQQTDAASSPGGLQALLSNPAALQALLKDPAQLQQLLQKHPQLISILKSTLGKPGG
jgi:hypothetical protein